MNKTMKKLILILTATILSLQGINAKDASGFFPQSDLMRFGSYYYPEQWEQSQWGRDLKNMASLGVDFTHFAEFAWANLEPDEGVYDFAWLDKAVEIASKNGLKVILCTPSAAPPVWLTKKYPEVLIVNEEGVRAQHGCREQASWSSMLYRKFVSDIVTRLAQRYGNNPNVIGWQIDNEPSHYGRLDYSENAQKRFRQWLENKYKTIGVLNKTWGTAFWSETYQNFDQVRIPNQVELPAKPNPHSNLDYQRFMADEVADFVNMQADILHQYISKKQWVTSNVISQSQSDPARMTHLDFATYTYYPVSGSEQGYGDQGFRLSAPHCLGIANDLYRNYTGKVYGVMELQPGQVNWGSYNTQPMPGAVRLWVYHVFAGGSKFVCNYRYREPLTGSEQYHYGLMGTDGVTLYRGGHEYQQAIGEMAKLRKEYDKSAKMPDEIAARHAAMLINMDNRIEMDFQPQTYQWNTGNHQKHYYDALKSFAAPVDLIGEDEDFSKYPFLVAPSYELIDSALVTRWTEYVKAGGNLILTCRTGQKNREDKLWEALFAAPIHDLVGIDTLFYDQLPDNRQAHVDFNGKSYQWNNWGDVLSVRKGVDSWGTYADQFYKGKTAVAHRHLGKGTVTYIGADTDDGALERDVLRRVYEEAGVKVENLPNGVLHEWRDGFHIALNYSSDTYKVAIPASAKILIGSDTLAPAGVAVWKEK